MSEELDWFNGLQKEVKLRLISSQYHLHLSIRDRSTEEIVDTLSKKFENERLDLNRKIDILREENSVINRTAGFNFIMDKMEEMENNLLLNQKDLEGKLTSNHVKGIIGENFIERIVSQIPNCQIDDVSREKGLTDFKMYIKNEKFAEDHVCLIESKNVEKVSLENLNNFRKDVLEADEKIHFAIFVAQRAITISGRIFSIECLSAKDHNMFLFFISDVFNNPERLLIAIQLGQTLSNNLIYSKNVHKIMHGIDKVLININKLSENINKLSNGLKTQQTIIENCKKDVSNLFSNIKNISEEKECGEEQGEMEIVVPTISLKEVKKIPVINEANRIAEENEVVLDAARQLFESNPGFKKKDLVEFLSNVMDENVCTNIVNRRLLGLKRIKERFQEVEEEEDEINEEQEEIIEEKKGIIPSKLSLEIEKIQLKGEKNDSTQHARSTRKCNY